MLFRCRTTKQIHVRNFIASQSPSLSLFFRRAIQLSYPATKSQNLTH